MGKGSGGERETVNRLEDEMGWRALRAPGSGSGTDRDRPDVLAGRDGRVVMFEVKTSSGKPVYVGREEVEALQRYAEDFGAEAYIAVRWKSNQIRDTTIYVCEPTEMHQTEKFYRAKYEDCVEKDAWRALSEVCG
ncbi:Holliday junction resolvase [Haloarcula hispanica tailed virus 2]|uniref:Holliday junction resolvase n=1 Tax=Haloarcula hispanica tailed virus 2 TaxID=1273751 RepID=R4TG75_9CAUD|nr:Holliday junction resolvase [Haloarcula hispanica tailed virus 2]AGM11231.1 holliday junction resolvase [Haloarcula hispanica tailed virus 2]